MTSHASSSSSARLVALGALSFSIACEIVPPAPDAGDMPAVARFGATACYQCTRAKCVIPVQACASNAECTVWLDCVTQCPTDDGVSARSRELSRCGVPVAAGALFECIQDYSSGFLLGCEAACTPPADS